MFRTEVPLLQETDRSGIGVRGCFVSRPPPPHLRGPRFSVTDGLFPVTGNLHTCHWTKGQEGSPGFDAKGGKVFGSGLRFIPRHRGKGLGVRGRGDQESTRGRPVTGQRLALSEEIPRDGTYYPSENNMYPYIERRTGTETREPDTRPFMTQTEVDVSVEPRELVALGTLLRPEVDCPDVSGRDDRDGDPE